MVKGKENHIFEAKLPVKPIVQSYNFDCGLAAMKTFLGSVGKEVSEEVLQRFLKTNRRSGTAPKGILEFLKFFGFEFVEMRGASVSDIENKISDGYYCLVVYQAWGSRKEHRNLLSGHYSLAFGFDEAQLHLADPAVVEADGLGMGEGVRALSKEAFDKDWADQDYQGNIYDHWMVAVKA